MKNQLEIEAVIFDMDGVVVDTMPLLYRAWSAMMGDEFGVKFSKKFFLEEVSGRRAPEAVEHILRKKPDNEFLSGLNDKKAKYYREYLTKELKETSGVIKFLKFLSKKKIKVGLATSSYKKEVKYILKKIGAYKYFDVFITAEKVKKSKPDPEVFLRAAKAMKTKPENCVVFEDAPLGVLAAKRAGMTAVGVGTYHNKKILRKADFYIKDFKERKLYRFIDQAVAYKPERGRRKKSR